jgi:transcriptional regulator with XRE-family HTH domain
MTGDEMLVSLGARVRALRLAHRLPQRELADKVGYSRASIANLETGRQNTPLSTLSTIAAYFKVPIGALLGEVPLPEVPVITTAYTLRCSLCDWTDATSDPGTVERLASEHSDSHLRAVSP